MTGGETRNQANVESLSVVYSHQEEIVFAISQVDGVPTTGSRNRKYETRNR